MKTRRFTGQYAPDGKQRRSNVRAEAGHRCIRCGHPFENGKHGKGEWSPCDEQCTHMGPIGMQMDGGVMSFVGDPSVSAGDVVKAGLKNLVAQWRILTIHHADGDKANDHWSNTLPLCQRCHLTIQGKVDPRLPWFLPHSEWIKPYVAAWNAKKYEGREITCEQAEAEMDRLLAYECKVTA